MEHNNNLIKNWINEYISNIKDPLYAVIMNVLSEANPNEVLEVYKNMGTAKISNDNRDFLLTIIKKLELDKKLKAKDRKALRISEKMIKKGNSIEDIIELTELTKDKIIELKKQYQQ